MARKNLQLKINRYLKFFNPIRVSKNIAWRYLCSSSNRPHVFVIGAPRSGTSLMFTTIKSHQSFASVEDETYFFVPRDVFNNNYRGFDCTDSLSQLEFRQLRHKSKDLVNFYDNLTQIVLDRQNAQIFIEKTPHHSLYLPFLLKNFTQAKFINMIRDGRDCYVSHQKLESHLHSSVTEFAKMWRNMVETRQKIAEHPRILDIKYETLTQKPSATMAKVMSFLEEEFSPEQINPERFSNTRILQYKGHESLRNPINSNSVGKWRKQMNAAEINEFNRIAGHTLQKLGYEVDCS